MADFSDAFRGQVSPELIPILERAVSDQEYFDSLETISAPGALDPEIRTSLLEVDGTDAFTLADAPATTPVGTLKFVICTAAVNTPAGTLTPDTGSVTSILFNAVGEAITMMWNGAVIGWSVVGAEGATVTP